MKHVLKYWPLVLTVFWSSCGHKLKTRSAQHSPQESTGPIFSKGERITNENFKGTAYLYSLITADSLNQTDVGNVTFEPGARTKWHMHPAGQILLATDGVGYYQEKGKQKIIFKKGDVIKCPPNIPHWHGAGTDTSFVQVAITGRQNGPTVWLEHVTEEEYHASEK